MQARKAARVLPEPVGAEIKVVRPARMCGQPCSWGSVGVPKRRTNHSCTRGWAQAREEGTDSIRQDCSTWMFAKPSPSGNVVSGLWTIYHCPHWDHCHGSASCATVEDKSHAFRIHNYGNEVVWSACLIGAP